MHKNDLLHTFQVDCLTIRVFGTKLAMGAAAAAQAAATLAQAIRRRNRARVVIATGPSQDEVIDSLVALPGVDWSRTEVFHMDEYVGISDSHPASFRRWLRTRVVDRVHPQETHYLHGDADDLAGECSRYAALLNSSPIDLCFVGFGENGHIAFNDPHTADFEDPLTVKRVSLDEVCRRQQVGEGHFPNVGVVPAEAITLSCRALMAAEVLICCVPDRRKAKAVRRTLDGTISPECPASLVRRHPRASLYLDIESASLVETPVGQPQ